MGAVDLDDLADRLERWAVAHVEGAAGVTEVEVMPGHAGLSFGFRVVDASGTVLEDLVVRLPPKGVRRRGNTDVLRQVPLLKAMARCGVPVAEVRHWGDDEQWFEVPYLMVGRLAGSTFLVRECRPGARDVFDQAVDALAAVHQVDWTAELGGWEEPRLLDAEIRFWDPILAKAAESAWVGQGEQVRELLLSARPGAPHVGVLHGDYQTSNLIFDDGRLVAVLDWELSGIGATLLDLGWLLMMNDPRSWADGTGMERVPPFAELVARCAHAVGRPVTLDDVAWYRALAGYRFGVISCFNVMLHRSGKRPDAEWERIAPSVPHLFGRAAELLAG